MEPMKITYIIIQDINTPDRTGEMKDFDVEFMARIHGSQHLNEVGKWANGAIIKEVHFGFFHKSLQFLDPHSQ